MTEVSVPQKDVLRRLWIPRCGIVTAREDCLPDWPRTDDVTATEKNSFLLKKILENFNTGMLQLLPETITFLEPVVIISILILTWWRKCKFIRENPRHSEKTCDGVPKAFYKSSIDFFTLAHWHVITLVTSQTRDLLIRRVTLKRSFIDRCLRKIFGD